MSTERDRVNLDALVRPPTVTLPGGVVLREMSAGVVVLAKKLGLRLLGADREARIALSPDEFELELYALAWLMSTPPSAAWADTRTPWDCFRDDILLPWIYTLPATAIAPLIDAVLSRLEELGAASVEPAPRHPSDPESPPGNT